MVKSVKYAFQLDLQLTFVASNFIVPCQPPNSITYGRNTSTPSEIFSSIISLILVHYILVRYHRAPQTWTPPRQPTVYYHEATFVARWSSAVQLFKLVNSRTQLKIPVIFPEFQVFFCTKISGPEKLSSQRIKVGIFVNYLL